VGDRDAGHGYGGADLMANEERCAKQCGSVHEWQYAGKMLLQK